MRADSVQGSPIVAASAASAAFQVAVVQQKQFEETLERVSEKQDQAVKESIRKAERTDDVVDINEIDKVVEGNKVENGNADSGPSPAPETVGSNVNVSV